jgi:hypothetical protein
MTPARVIAGLENVAALAAASDGEPSALASPKSRTLTTPSEENLDVGRFQIAVDDAAVVRRLEGFGHLTGDREHILERHRSGRDLLGQRGSVHQFHDDGAKAVAVSEAEDLRDVRVIEGGQHLRLTLEPREALRVGGHVGW